ncbi:hypothetical protein [Sphingosinicella sp. BN140058]|uniref:hypothetical protein n=1 Tax=Sphingosinicella sp. BN140058 TaxID=1892855 RepID=UPI0010136551|nr:hypothetical protein [Sphingosinicella sp. BN140058]QAY79370.1 hypothetical protein ETR14_24630 [Sphingosinicella sp. BN140058]
MSVAEITRARREAEIARRKLMGDIAVLQERLSPTTIATNAWEGVKERSTEIADDAVEAVKARPVAVSAALGAVTLFLARNPIKSAVSWLFAKKPPEDLVTTRLDTNNPQYDLTTPVVARKPDEGVTA